MQNLSELFLSLVFKIFIKGGYYVQKAITGSEWQKYGETG